VAHKPTGAQAPKHAPIGHGAFLSIRLTRDPDEAYAAVCRILAGARDPEAALAECSPYVDGFGVEALALADGATLHYVNTGDTYRATLCHVADRGYFVSSWGDVYEAADRAHEEQSGERRCAYCSAWCEPAEPCGSCGRDPSTGDPMPETLRHVRLESGHTLRTWDTGRTRNGRTCMGYELRDLAGAVLFRGEDFGPSPMHADDSDEALRALLGFLTLRPGDTDRECFANYTQAQLDFANEHGELLGFIYSDDVVGTDNAGTFEDVDGESEGGGS